MKREHNSSMAGKTVQDQKKHVRKKSFLKGLLAFAVTFGILVFLTVLMMPADYLLTRFNPDSSINMGYIDPDHLSKETWTTLAQTSYENGVETASTVFKRQFLSNYTIAHTPANGEPTVLVGESIGNHTRWEYLGPKIEENRFLSSSYGNDLLGRINDISIKSGKAYGPADELLNYLQIEYSTVVADWLMQQNKCTTVGEVITYRKYDYADHRISLAKDYDADGTLLGYTEYTYGETTCSTASYTADGRLTGSSQAQYDWFGRIQRREQYDETGSLVSREVYRYRFWERFFSLEGLCALLIILSLSTAVGLCIYEDWHKIPFKKRVPPASRLDVGSKLVEQLEEARAALTATELSLQEMDEPSRAKVRSQLEGPMAELEEVLSRWHRGDSKGK